MLRFSSMVRSRSLVSACGITPIARRAPSGSFCTSCPATRAVPAVMGMSVVIMRIRVDFPAPLGPSRPKISSSFTKKETSSTAVNSPYFFTMWSTSMALTTGPDALFPLARAGRVGEPPFALKSATMALLPPLYGRLLAGRGLELFLRDQHLGRHPGHIRPLGIVQTDLENDGSDVALAPAHVALGGEVSLR